MRGTSLHMRSTLAIARGRLLPQREGRRPLSLDCPSSSMRRRQRRPGTQVSRRTRTCQAFHALPSFLSFLTLTQTSSRLPVKRRCTFRQAQFRSIHPATPIHTHIRLPLSNSSSSDPLRRALPSRQPRAARRLSRQPHFHLRPSSSRLLQHRRPSSKAGERTRTRPRQQPCDRQPPESRPCSIRRRPRRRCSVV